MESLRIKKVTIEAINIKLDEPFTIAIGTKYNIENALISLELENGIVGYGEAAPLEPINGENQATALATLDACKDFLLGKSVSDYRNISRHLKTVFWAQITARCAIEMALLDAYTKSLNIPLYKFLGGIFQCCISQCHCRCIRHSPRHIAYTIMHNTIYFVNWILMICYFGCFKTPTLIDTYIIVYFL